MFIRRRFRLALSAGFLLAAVGSLYIYQQAANFTPEFLSRNSCVMTDVATEDGDLLKNYACSEPYRTVQGQAHEEMTKRGYHAIDRQSEMLFISGGATKTWVSFAGTDPQSSKSVTKVQVRYYGSFWKRLRDRLNRHKEPIWRVGTR